MARLGWFRVGLLSLALAVALGAFGAHGLQSLVNEARLETWHTAVRYQAWISLALVAIASWRGDIAAPVFWCLLLGMVVFSGSLYALVLLDFPRLGAITPLGGVLLISGLGWAAFSAKRPD